MTFVECDREPLAPVTFARKFPAEEPIQERVEVPEPPLMLVDDNEQDRIVEFVATPRATVPVNPLSEVIVIEEVPDVSIVVDTFVGLADIAKSGAAVTR